MIARRGAGAAPCAQPWLAQQGWAERRSTLFWQGWDAGPWKYRLPAQARTMIRLPGPGAGMCCLIMSGVMM
jgi:hypothetical protein